MSVEPLCLCSEWQLYTEDGVHGRESQQEAAHHDCIFQALTFFLLIHRGITQGQLFLVKYFCYGNYVQWHTFDELFAIIYCIIIKYVN